MAKGKQIMTYNFPYLGYEIVLSPHNSLFRLSRM